MNESYRKKLFDSYCETHADTLESPPQERASWFLRHVSCHYSHHLTHLSPETARILEIGCNRGYLLAALQKLGYRNLWGVDLSPGDLAKAKTRVPGADLAFGDAADYLADRAGFFDVIVLKAVLEHIEKDRVIPFLEKIRSGLRFQGTALIDVPNMDWIFATHERYMDFTHETGFTGESLQQVMSNVFPQVEVAPLEHYMPSTLLWKARKMVGRYILGKLFDWADPQGSANWIWARSILGVGHVGNRPPAPDRPEASKGAGQERANRPAGAATDSGKAEWTA